MSDYSKAVIYKLHKDDMTEIYIGSTSDKKERERLHKTDCNNENVEQYNYKVYKFIRVDVAVNIHNVINYNILIRIYIRNLSKKPKNIIKN